MYITRLVPNEIFSTSNTIHREVGRTKDLSAPLYLAQNFDVSVIHPIWLLYLPFLPDILSCNNEGRQRLLAFSTSFPYVFHAAIKRWVAK